MVTVTFKTLPKIGDISQFYDSIAAPISLSNNPIESFVKYVFSQ